METVFGINIKLGIYNGFGQNKDTLKDLILFLLPL